MRLLNTRHMLNVLVWIRSQIFFCPVDVPKVTAFSSAMLYLPGYKSSGLTAVTALECSWLQSVVSEWSRVDAPYLGAAEDSSGAAESAGSLCGGSDPAGAPATLLDSSWRFRSQKACSPESSPRSGSSYTGEQAWTGTSPAEREKKEGTERDAQKHHNWTL